MTVKLRYVSLGLGVQSSTVLFMADRGEIGPRPDCAIFADPGWESAATYEYLAYVRERVSIPIHVVSAGNIREDLLRRQSARSGRFVTVPYFLKTVAPNGAIKEGMGRRQCTAHYKIEPIYRKVRELLGVGPRGRIAAGSAEAWVGISVDEIIRATPSKVRFETRKFPLLELGMDRVDCKEWMRDRQIRLPPKSACVGCPYHSNAHWREMKLYKPEEFAQAVEVDRAIRGFIYKPMDAEQFTHRSLLPLDEVDFSNAEDRGQLNLFINECEGMCGT